MGSLENLESINCKDLYEHYLKFIKTLPMYVFVSGDLKPEDIDYIKDNLFKIDREEVIDIKEAEIEIAVDKVKM